jgi:hypothetical protein
MCSGSDIEKEYFYFLIKEIDVNHAVQALSWMKNKILDPLLCMPELG